MNGNDKQDQEFTTIFVDLSQGPNNTYVSQMDHETRTTK